MARSRPTPTRSRSRSRNRWAGGAVAAVAAIAVATAFAAPIEADDGPDAVVVANRGSGDLSVIDTGSLGVATVALPDAAQPMYVNHDPLQGLVWVGDRNNDRVLALDDDTFDVVATVSVDTGVFHQWVDPELGQLWVVGDTSGTVTVVDTAARSVLATIPVPADLAAAGGRAHDVFVAGDVAFVSILGLDDGSGAVVQFSTADFSERARVSTGDDPHLFVSQGSLFVASQDGSSVSRYRASDLRLLAVAEVPAAHGIWVTDRREVLATNIAGGGTDAVWSLNRSLQHVGDVFDTSVAVPHNLTVVDGRQVFVTHSGATANQVTVADLDDGSSVTVTVGTNPFGLGVVD